MIKVGERFSVVGFSNVGKVSLFVNGRLVAAAGLFDLRERLFPDSLKDGEHCPDNVDLPLVALPGAAWDE